MLFCVCEKCKTTMQWVTDNDGSLNLVCHSCKYYIRRLPQVAYEGDVNMQGYGNHSCNDCGNKSCPISNHLSKPNECSYYDPPMANTVEYPQWYIKELEDMAKLKEGIYVWRFTQSNERER